MDVILASLKTIPADDRSALEDALQQAPDLVRLESNPEYYLSFDSSDAVAACRRIALYWAVRFQFFGPRALLPMTITGDGAMSAEDIRLLDSGFLMLLPNDRQGRAVVFNDRARLLTAEQMEHPIKRARCLFYLLSVASESESCRQHGLIYLTAYSDRTRKTSFDFNSLVECITFLKKEVFPFHAIREHLVMLSQRQSLKQIVPLTLDAYQRAGFMSGKVIVHEDKTDDEILDRLKTHDFDLEGLPTIPFGGLFTLGCFRRWLDQRSREEAHRIGVHATGQNEDSSARSATNEQVDEESRRKRETDAMYARRKRAKLKIELKVLRDEVERLTNQQREIRAIGMSLEARLRAANDAVQAHVRDTSALSSTVPARIAASEDSLSWTSGASGLAPSSTVWHNLVSNTQIDQRDTIDRLTNLNPPTLQRDGDSLQQPRGLSLFNTTLQEGLLLSSHEARRETQTIALMARPFLGNGVQMAEAASVPPFPPEINSETTLPLSVSQFPFVQDLSNMNHRLGASSLHLSSLLTHQPSVEMLATQFHSSQPSYHVGAHGAQPSYPFGTVPWQAGISQGEREPDERQQQRLLLELYQLLLGQRR